MPIIVEMKMESFLWLGETFLILLFGVRGNRGFRTYCHYGYYHHIAKGLSQLYTRVQEEKLHYRFITFFTTTAQWQKEIMLRPKNNNLLAIHRTQKKKSKASLIFTRQSFVVCFVPLYRFFLIQLFAPLCVYIGQTSHCWPLHIRVPPPSSQ